MIRTLYYIFSHLDRKLKNFHPTTILMKHRSFVSQYIDLQTKKYDVAFKRSQQSYKPSKLSRCVTVSANYCKINTQDPNKKCPVPALQRPCPAPQRTI